MSAEMNYQRLNADNFTGHSLDDFVRRQTVTECWRKMNNAWKLVPNVYEENSFPWPAKRRGRWARTNCIFRLILQKSRRRHTGHLDAVSQKKSMRNWQQRSPLMSKWNTDYKSASAGT